ncbi:MAG: CxxC-x17-CxxC domain-containing protein [Nitrosopumilaceae archaeon]|nr:CxxC-x17-CxxC domain-containing protein [Nitrosopumilaceae archaeon]
MFLQKIELLLIEDKAYTIMSQDRKMYKCTCADCGNESEVPFEPKQGRPVYCRECLPKHRSRRF